MSSLFTEVLDNVGGVEKRLLGPTYPYWKNIKSPEEIGMSDQGTMSQIGKNIDGITDYVEVLVTGKGASATGNPMGNKFFLKTGGKCKDVKNGKLADRYIYINNIPMGNIPFISQGMGADFKEFRGLIPGAMSNLNTLNPFTIMQSFMTGSKPKCRALDMEVVDNQNNSKRETHHVTDTDIRSMDACNWGGDGKNPLTNERCQQAFMNMEVKRQSVSHIEKNIYCIILCIIVSYIIYKSIINI